MAVHRDRPKMPETPRRSPPVYRQTNFVNFPRNAGLIGSDDQPYSQDVPRPPREHRKSPSTDYLSMAYVESAVGIGEESQMPWPD